MAYPAQLAFKDQAGRATASQRLGGLGAVRAAADRRARRRSSATATRWSSRWPGATAPADRAPRGRALRRRARHRALPAPVGDDERAPRRGARRQFAGARLSAYDQETGEGLLRFLMLREGRRTGEAMVNVVTSAPDVAALAPLARGAAGARAGDGQRRAERQRQEGERGGRRRGAPAAAGATTSRSRSSGVHVPGLGRTRSSRPTPCRPSGCSRSWPRPAALDGSETLIDLYSGTGAISLLLARRCRHVYGIEVAEAAVADAVRNARGQRDRQLHVPGRRGAPRAARR